MHDVTGRRDRGGCLLLGSISWCSVRSVGGLLELYRINLIRRWPGGGLRIPLTNCFSWAYDTSSEGAGGHFWRLKGKNEHFADANGRDRRPSHPWAGRAGEGEQSTSALQPYTQAGLFSYPTLRTIPGSSFFPKIPKFFCIGF